MANDWHSARTGARDPWADEITPPAHAGRQTVTAPAMQGNGTVIGGMSGAAGSMMNGGTMMSGSDMMMNGSTMTGGNNGMMNAGTGGGTQMPSGQQMANQNSDLNMITGLPEDVVVAPTTVSEAYLGSLKALLNNNKGNYVVAAFLIGNQSPVTWEGILYEVGNDFITIFQEVRNRYIVCDIYSLKFIEFYDIRGRQR